jgi:hypothetical protein
MWARVLKECPVSVTTEEEVLGAAVARESVDDEFKNIRG